jgi:diacylglycerol kinase family enzyme
MNRPKRDFVFMLNPAAWHGDAGSRLDARLKRAACVPARSTSFSAQNPAEAAAALERAGPDAIPVAVGGDATVALPVQAIGARGEGERAFGVLPFGTGR